MAQSMARSLASLTFIEQSDPGSSISFLGGRVLREAISKRARRSNTFVLGALALMVVGCSAGDDVTDFPIPDDCPGADCHMRMDAGAPDAWARTDIGAGACSPQTCFAFDEAFDCCDPESTMQAAACYVDCPDGYRGISACEGFLCEPSDDSSPEECAAVGFQEAGLTLGPTRVDHSFEATVKSIDRTAESARVTLRPRTAGADWQFVAPTAHLVGLAPGTEVSLESMRVEGVSASRLTWATGTVVAFYSTHLPFPSGDLPVSGVSIRLADVTCSGVESPQCGRWHRYALEAQLPDGTVERLQPGGSVEFIATEDDGSELRGLVSHGAATRFACDTCECIAEGLFVAVVSSHLRVGE